jgi:hypothetical protein
MDLEESGCALISRYYPGIRMDGLEDLRKEAT